jgi:hypothetical protein
MSFGRPFSATVQPQPCSYDQVRLTPMTKPAKEHGSQIWRRPFRFIPCLPINGPEFAPPNY